MHHVRITFVTYEEASMVGAKVFVGDELCGEIGELHWDLKSLEFKHY